MALSGLSQQGRLDLLVNNAWCGPESFDGVFDAPFWQHPLAHWDSMFDRGVRNPVVASRCATRGSSRRQRPRHDAGASGGDCCQPPPSTLYSVT